MSIKVDIANQVRQTTLPAWKPLLPVFEAVINSLQAIRDAKLSPSVQGHIVIQIDRGDDLFKDDDPLINGFSVKDNGIGLDDDNFDSFNTAYSPYKLQMGGKGLGRFMWLKAFEKAEIDSTFHGENGLLCRTFTFDDHYDLDERGLPRPVSTGAPGTTVKLIGLRSDFIDQCPRSTEVFVQKLIEHFILMLLEPACPKISVHDRGRVYDVNEIFSPRF